jgi:hypothetical protein
MEEMLMQTVHRIIGVDPAAMGIDIDDKAGIITMMRQCASARNLQRLFDQFDESQRLCGDIICQMIQKNWTYGKVKQVIGEEPTAEFDNKAFFKYGAKVIQGVLTESQQQLELGQLLHLKEIFGDQTPPPVMQRIIDSMFISNKDELKQQIAEFQKQQSEQAQKMEQLQMQQMQIDNQAKISYAHSQDGLAAERIQKIQVDRAVAADKLKRAGHEDMESLLAIVKALKELQGMDTEHLKSKIETLNAINELNFQGEQEALSSQGANGGGKEGKVSSS